MDALCSPSGWDRIDNLTENAQKAPAACTARLAPFGACCIQHQKLESRDRSDSQGIQRWPPPGDSEAAGGSSRAVLCHCCCCCCCRCLRSRLSPELSELPEDAVFLTYYSSHGYTSPQRPKICPTCGLAKDDWTTMLQTQIFPSA